VADEKPEEDVKISDLPWSRRIPAVLILVCMILLLIAASGVVAGALYKLFMAGFSWSTSW